MINFHEQQNYLCSTLSKLKLQAKADSIDSKNKQSISKCSGRLRSMDNMEFQLLMDRNISIESNKIKQLKKRKNEEVGMASRKNCSFRMTTKSPYIQKQKRRKILISSRKRNSALEASSPGSLSPHSRQSSDHIFLINGQTPKWKIFESYQRMRFKFKILPTKQ